MKYEYIPAGVCSRRMEIEIDGDIITDIKVEGGCNGNLKGISALCRGRKKGDVIAALSGLTCGHKGTSCPDQLARALAAIKD